MKQRLFHVLCLGLLISGVSLAQSPLVPKVYRHELRLVPAPKPFTTPVQADDLIPVRRKGEWSDTPLFRTIDEESPTRFYVYQDRTWWEILLPKDWDEKNWSDAAIVTDDENL